MCEATHRMVLASLPAGLTELERLFERFHRQPFAGHRNRKWENVNAFEIKIALGMDILRCQSPEMVETEILIHLIAYNLIRAFMQRAAHIRHVDLGRMSFKGALDTSRHFASVIHAASATPRKQQALIAEMLTAIAADPVPSRPHRSEPRAKIRRPKNYHLLTKPRHAMTVSQHRNRWKAKNPKSRLS